MRDYTAALEIVTPRCTREGGGGDFGRSIGREQGCGSGPCKHSHCCGGHEYGLCLARIYFHMPVCRQPGQRRRICSVVSILACCPALLRVAKFAQ